jgi:hypothetical protein
MLLLGLTFFALSSEYRTLLLDEYYLMAKFLRTSWSDFLIIPTYSRKYLIDRIIELNTPKDNQPKD